MLTPITRSLPQKLSSETITTLRSTPDDPTIDAPMCVTPLVASSDNKCVPSCGPGESVYRSTVSGKRVCMTADGFKSMNTMFPGKLVPSMIVSSKPPPPPLPVRCNEPRIMSADGTCSCPDGGYFIDFAPGGCVAQCPEMSKPYQHPRLGKICQETWTTKWEAELGNALRSFAVQCQSPLRMGFDPDRTKDLPWTGCVAQCAPGTSPYVTKPFGARICLPPEAIEDYKKFVPSFSFTPDTQSAGVVCASDKVSFPIVGCITKTQRNIGIGVVAAVALFLLLKKK